MHTFFAQKTIDIDSELAWRIVSDFANTYTYHPLVEHSESLNGQQTGLGAKRRCTMYGGKSVEEVITFYDEDARHYRVEVVDHGPFPLTHMVVDIKVQSESQGQSQVSFSGTFEPKFGPVGWLMAKVAMKRQFESMLTSVIVGLEQHARTGLIVGEGGKLVAQAA